MWDLYIVMSMLTAGVVIKVVHPLLGRGRHAGAGIAPSAADRRLSLLLTGIIPAAALALYVLIGRPDLPGHPAIFFDPITLIDRQESLLAKRPFETLVKRNPDDMGALIKLATINQRLGHYADAVRFMQRAVVIARRQDDMLLRIYAENLGRLQVLANSGIVGPDALGTFDYVRSISTVDPIARYYQALSKAQKGDAAGAIEDWTAMLAQGTSLAYWKQPVREAIAVTKAGMLGKAPLNGP